MKRLYDWADGAPIATADFLAAHPTVMAPDALAPGLEPYSGPVVYNNPSIRSAFEWPFDLALRPVDPSGHDCDPWHEGCTVKGPRAGIVSMGGAQDGRTICR